MNIGLFGGSFDPAHKGHVRLLKTAVRACALDKTVVLPAACSPFKTGVFSSDADRLALCARSFPDSEISDYEIVKGGKSYTVETVRHFRELYPDDRLFLIIGEDQLLIFQTWFSFREILENAVLVAASRTDETVNAALEAHADAYLRPFGEVRVLPYRPFPVSSTGIREKVAAGESIRGLVTPAAEKYILEKGLYRDI